MSLTAEQCDEFWSIADKNGDGELTVHELAAAIKLYQPSHPGKNYRPPTQKDIAYMFSEIDKDGDMKITKSEFMSEMRKPCRSETLCKMFKEADKNGDGTLSRDEVRDLIRSSGTVKPEKMDEVVDAILNSADTSGDGVISYDEFLKALQ